MILALLATASARPEAPEIFCEVYADSPHCVSSTASCTMCHSLSGPPAHNDFGADLGVDPEAFGESLPEALIDIQDLDSDGDGLSNLDEILGGGWPGLTSADEPECASQSGTNNDWYRVGEYDHAFAYRRVMLDFCGRSPRYDEVRAFADADDPDQVLQDTLDLCLESPYWGDVLRELAVGAVQPAGPATDINTLGNWAWDLRLFQYVMSGDRDAGEALTADYFVIESPAESGNLVAIDDPRNELETYAQPLDAEHRYGLITTRYALSMRVMFSEVPRTLAAHVYREFLGLDIARSEGLYPVDESDGAYDWPAPLDVDDKGVWQEECAGCHSTLDGLSYPWARYNGIDLEGGTGGQYLEDRATDVLPTTDGVIFGDPISTPAEWVEAAVTSDAFAENTTSMFWDYLMRRTPYSCEQEEYQALWTDFRDNGRNVHQMLSLLITTEAYGVP